MENKNNNVITIVLVILLIGAAFYIGKLSSEVKGSRGDKEGTALLEEPDEQVVEKLAPVTEEDHIRGNADAKLALVEYSDFECPYCQSFHPTAKQAIDEYSEDLMWVYRHFPLDQIHADARPAAIASECVASLGGNDAFWTYTDTLYETGELNSQALLDEALALGINEEEFNACIEDDATNDLVDDDLASGIKAGVNGTPGNFILNLETGEVSVLPGAVPFAQVQAAIEEMLSAN